MKLQINYGKARAICAGASLLALSSALPAFADYQSTVLSQNPAAYWRLNETTIPSSSIVGATNSGSLGNSANGIYSNAPTRSLAGPKTGSQAIGLDGISQCISTPWQAGINPSPFTFEIWANPAQVPKFAYLASSVEVNGNRSGWYLAQDDSSTFGLGNGFVVRMFNQNGATPTATLFVTNSLPLGSWYHLVLTYDGSTATLYANGVVSQTASSVGFVPNVDAVFTVGRRSDNGFPWPGKVAEAAMYNTALSAARVSAHYNAATSTAYGTAVSADAPVLWYRFQEPPDPAAANIGTLGASLNGLYIYDALPNQVGPRPASFPGFSSTNTAVTFDGGPGSVKIPAFNFTTNRFSVTAWMKPNGAQAALAGIFTGRAGLQFDVLNTTGFELAYSWGDTSASNVESFIYINDAQWNFASLIVQPDQAIIYVPGQTPFTNVMAHGAVNFNINSFIGNGAAAFNGSLDEVSVFNRTIGLGEAYSQYATAVGGLGPQIFSSAAPNTDVIVGDTLTLFVDVGGTPNLSYQWRKESVPIPGATDNPLSKPNMALGDAGNYDLVISNAFGVVTSAVSVVTTEVASAPAIQQRPVGRTLYPGGTLNLTVTATGGGLKYQWQRSSTNLPGATSSSYYIASVSNANAGSYSVIVSNSIGTTNLGPAVITIPSPAGSSYAGQIVASAPEAWWRLGESAGSTNLADGMGRHDGYYTNLSQTVPPVTLGVAGIANPDTAASFNGSSPGVGVIPFSPDLNYSTFTYEGWVKTTALGNYQVPFSSADTNGGGIWLAMVTGTTPATWEPAGSGGYFDIWNASDPTPHSFTTLPVVSGTWTHLVLCYDANQTINGTHFPWKFYVNGATDDGYVWSLGANTINTSGPYIIGGRATGDPATVADSFFNGQVDEVAVYKRVLTAAEVTAHYNAGFTPTPPTFATTFLPQTVSVGKTVTFGTIVQGSTPLSLQWYKGSTLIAGATTNSLTIANAALSDTATYTLWATNSVGTNSQSVALTVVAPVAYANVTNGSVLHLKFENNTADSSGHNNNGTAVGSPSFVAGIIGAQALQYTTTTVTNSSSVTATSSSYVNLGTPADLSFGASDSFSVGFWVKLPAGASGGDLPFIGNAVGSMNNPGWDLGPTYGGGGWQWCLNDGVTSQPVTNNIDVNGPANSINDGGWHYFLLSVDRSAPAARTYLDGVLVGNNNLTGFGGVNNGSAVVIGQDPTGTYPQIPSGASANDLAVWGPTQTATLDDLGVWRRSLTPLEVAHIESAGRTGHNSFDTVAPPVTITVTRSGGNVTLSWSSGVLLQSDTVGPTAVWTQVPGATAPSYTFTPAGASKFYRVLVQ